VHLRNLLSGWLWHHDLRTQEQQQQQQQQQQLQHNTITSLAIYTLI
jgi:hypothetical protein